MDTTGPSVLDRRIDRTSSTTTEHTACVRTTGSPSPQPCGRPALDAADHCPGRNGLRGNAGYPSVTNWGVSRRTTANLEVAKLQLRRTFADQRERRRTTRWDCPSLASERLHVPAKPLPRRPRAAPAADPEEPARPPVLHARGCLAGSPRARSPGRQGHPATLRDAPHRFTSRGCADGQRERRSSSAAPGTTAT